MSESTNDPMNQAPNATEPAGCSCGGCATDTQQTAPVALAADAEPEKRKGFHPVLVLATIAVVLFVLWFCPAAIMKARIPANEAAAAVCLLETPQLLLAAHPEITGAHWDSAKELTNRNLRNVDKQFQIKKLRNAATSELMLCLIPKYHGISANRSFCLFRGLLYTADLGAFPGDDQLSAPEVTMKRLK